MFPELWLNRSLNLQGQNNSSHFDVGVAVTSDQINAYTNSQPDLSSSQVSLLSSSYVATPVSPQPLYPDAITSPNPTRAGAHPDALQRPETPHRPMTPRLPGYIPGMPIPRPMTPRDPAFDSDRSHSTTPRANSPAVSPISTNFPYSHHSGHSTSGYSSPGYASTIPRRGSITTPNSTSASRMANTYASRSSAANSSSSAIQSLFGSEDIEQQQRHRGSPSLGGAGISPRTTSPGFNLGRSGSLASHDSHSNNNDRRRPVSPLSSSSQNQTYQPLAMPARPSTPSSITWVPQPSPSPSSSSISRPGGVAHRAESSISSSLMRSGSVNSSFGRAGGSSSGHSRGGSFGTDIGMHSTIHGELERAKMVSPALPDSPMLDVSSPGQVWERIQQQHHHRQGSSSGDASAYGSARDDRPSSLDLGSPVLGPTARSYTPPTAAATAASNPNAYRSGTPTQQLQQQQRAAAAAKSSPMSGGAFSSSGNTEIGIGSQASSDLVTAATVNNNRSLKHLSSSSSRPISPFVLNLGGSSSNPFMLSSLANGSRESLESTGSSYHSASWDSDARGKDLALNLFSDVDPLPPAWYSLDKSSAATSPDDDDGPNGLASTSGGGFGDDDVEDIIRRYAGLTKDDFVKIQKKLVDAAVAKSATPDLRERTPSLRRRRPSTSMSANSPIGREISRVRIFFGPLLGEVFELTSFFMHRWRVLSLGHKVLLLLRGELIPTSTHLGL
jgi:serine/arginine repetitive matrix protein 2